jgi:hypothetical protein
VGGGKKSENKDHQQGEEEEPLDLDKGEEL